MWRLTIGASEGAFDARGSANAQPGQGHITP
jgi:hypothetical protein